MEIVHTISFINISWTLFLILYGIVINSMIFLVLVVFLMILLQFYTNYSYYNIRCKLNPDKLDSFKKWKDYRQSILGWGVYSFLLICIYNLLIQFGIDFYFILLILSLVTHFLALLDKFTLKFLKSASNFFISFS